MYDPQKWQEDERRLREFYLDRGHVQASLGTPTLAYEDGSIGLFRKKPVKWVDVALPVDGGRRVRDRLARLPRADACSARSWCARCSR